MTPRRIDFDDPQRPRELATRRRNRTPRDHGWSRASDGRTPANGSSRLRQRAATGMPLLLLTVLGVMTFVGIARVKARVQVLEIADEISALTTERDELLDMRRRLEAERAYLRHPERVHARASADLGMVPASADRIQTIEVRAPEPAPEPADDGLLTELSEFADQAVDGAPAADPGTDPRTGPGTGAIGQENGQENAR